MHIASYLQQAIHNDCVLDKPSSDLTRLSFETPATAALDNASAPSTPHPTSPHLLVPHKSIQSILRNPQHTTPMLDRHLPINPLRTPHNFKQVLDDKRQPQSLHVVSFSETLREFGVERGKISMQRLKQSLAALVETEVVEEEMALFGCDAFTDDVEELEGVVEPLRC